MQQSDLSLVVGVVNNATAPLAGITDDVKRSTADMQRSFDKLSTAVGSDLNDAVSEFEKQFQQKLDAVTKDVQKYEKDVDQSNKNAAESTRDASSGIDRALEAQRNAFKEAAREVLRYAAAYVGLRAIYRSMTEAEDAVAKLTRTLDGVGAKSGVTIQQVSQIGKAIAESSKYGTTEVKIAAEQLVRFRAVSAQNIEPVLKITAALAQQMGVDLPQAAQVVARAMLAPSNATRLLRQYGVDLSATQLEQIRNYEKLGQKEKAQAIVLAELSRITNGGKTEVRTFSEALAQLRNTISDLVEGPEGGLSSVTEAVKGINEQLSNPATKAALDDFFGTMLKLLGQAIKGWGFLLERMDAVARFITRQQTDDAKYLENIRKVANIDEDIERQRKIASTAGAGSYGQRAAEKEIERLTKERNALMAANRAMLDKESAQRNSDAAVAMYGQIQKNMQPGTVGGEVDTTQIAKLRKEFIDKFVSEFGKNDEKISNQIETWNKNINDALKDGLITPQDAAKFTQRMVKVLTDSLSDLDPIEIYAKKVADMNPADFGGKLPGLTAEERRLKEDEASNSGPRKRAIQTYREQIAALQTWAAEMRAAGKAISEADVADRAKEIAEQLRSSLVKAADPTTEFEKEAQRNIQNAIEQFVLNPFKGGLKSLAGNIVNTFRQIFASLIAKNLAEGFMNSKLGKKITGGISEFIGGLFGNAGGGVIPPNSIARVGEDGEELVATGRNAMSVLNSRQINFARAGAGSITIAPTYQIDARGATTELIDALPAILEENTRQAVELARAAVLDDISRGAMRRM